MTRKMKDSGIEWIGMIPEGWNVVRTKYVAEITNGTDPKTDGDIPVYGSGGGSFKTCGEFKKGPAVLLGRKGTVDIPQYITGDYWNVDTAFDVKTNQTFNLKYFYYLSKCFDYRYYISTTTLPSMTQTNYGNIILPSPDINEQTRIADYLDAKCAEIDALIAAKEKSNALLKDYRQSIIFEAVTKGLDPNVPMKDSSIEWIGMIPEGWSVGRVKHYYHIVLGKMLQPNSKSETDELLPYMCAVNITWKGVDISTTKSMWFSKEERKNYKLHKGDLLVTEGGDVAVSCIWNDEIDDCYIQNAVHRVRPKDHGCNSFLYYWMTVLKNYGYIDMVCNKATLAHFTKEKLEECIYVAPSQSEQTRIVSYLDAKCAEIDALIEANEKTINQLKEYRQSVIFEVVTGKMDVS